MIERLNPLPQWIAASAVAARVGTLPEVSATPRYLAGAGDRHELVLNIGRAVLWPEMKMNHHFPFSRTARLEANAPVASTQNSCNGSVDQ
jgi:hypothetical protein